MNFQELKQGIDRMLIDMNNSIAAEPSAKNKIVLKQVSDALDDMDRMLSAFNYLNKLTIKPE